MKKLLSITLLLSLISFASIVRSQSVVATDPGFVMLDILLYRPVGLALTLVGGALFVGSSPFTALASIPVPHDAFDKTFKILVLAPAAYTFIRPVGDRRFTGYLPQQRRPIPKASINVEPTYQQPIPQASVLPPVQDDSLWSPNREKIH